MNGKERIQTALDRREPGRVPTWELGSHNAVATKVTVNHYDVYPNVGYFDGDRWRQGWTNNT
jgi:hypothetical protein